MQTRSSSNSPTNEDSEPATMRGRKAAAPNDAKESSALKCHWSPNEEKRLIEFLVSKKSVAGDGGNFKSPTWIEAVTEMAKFPTKGTNKNAKACSSKYSRLHTQYNIVTTLKGLSGLGSRYTTELGMNIGVTEQSVWNEYIKKNPISAPYAHKGFALYDAMIPLMPSLAKGNNVYRPSQATYGAASSTISQLSATDNTTGVGAEPNEQPPSPIAIDDEEDEGGPSMLPPSSRLSSPAPETHAAPDIASRSTTSAPHTSSSTSTASKRKQSALSTSQASSTSSKKQRTTSGAIVLYGIKESLDTFNATISKSTLMQSDRMRADTSPERWAKAVELIQIQEDYLTDDQLVAFLDLFRSDTPAADIYLSIKRESLRKAWIQKQLWKELGFPQDQPQSF